MRGCIRTLFTWKICKLFECPLWSLTYYYHFLRSDIWTHEPLSFKDISFKLLIFISAHLTASLTKGEFSLIGYQFWQHLLFMCVCARMYFICVCVCVCFVFILYSFLFIYNPDKCVDPFVSQILTHANYFQNGFKGTNYAFHGPNNVLTVIEYTLCS